MNDTDLARTWGGRFGLASAPLFEVGEIDNAGEHQVLLDGGFGTFVLSISESELWRQPDAASWVWSAGIPHHVTVSGGKVAVLRWDRPEEPRVFDRVSVERSLDRFYAFLNEDRVRVPYTVVDHLLGFFRRVRSMSAAAGIQDERTTDVFLASLAGLLAPEEVARSPESFGLAADVIEIQRRIDKRGMASLAHDVAQAAGAVPLLLRPELSIRHAGGQLFQEAHFELLRAPNSFDLFGRIADPEVRPRTRGGTHFTPAALARIIVEQSFNSMPDLASRTHLTICDPACGSGVFLHEALRTLRRIGYNGSLSLVGHDSSEAAVAMARFVLHAAVRDWQPQGGASIAIHAGDSLGELGMPAADVFLMNPPFVSFNAQTASQRAQLREIVAAAGSSRGDLSMAFIVKAMNALRPGGVLGTLYPASLLSLSAASGWREWLAGVGDVRLLGSLGDFGLFTHALVQVGALVIRNAAPTTEGVSTMLVTGDDARATGEALRALRKGDGRPPVSPVSGEGWSIFAIRSASLRTRPTWRLPSPRSERAIDALRSGQMPTVEELFSVIQGVQTGLNEALLLRDVEWKALPKREQVYFKLATMGDSISAGVVSTAYRVFFPHTSAGPRFGSEAELRTAVPTYFRLFLEPHRRELEARAALQRSNRTDWWGLNFPRLDWSVGTTPRLITKFFGAEGAFVADYSAEYIPVMGHVWLPKPPLLPENDLEIDLRELLSAYVAVLNSPPFAKILELFAPHVAGGQFDLSKRYVSGIPLPNLRDLASDPGRGEAVGALVTLGKAVGTLDASWREASLRAVTAIYGQEIIANLL